MQLVITLVDRLYYQYARLMSFTSGHYFIAFSFSAAMLYAAGTVTSDFDITRLQGFIDVATSATHTPGIMPSSLPVTLCQVSLISTPMYYNRMAAAIIIGLILLFTLCSRFCQYASRNSAICCYRLISTSRHRIIIALHHYASRRHLCICRHQLAMIIATVLFRSGED